LTESTAPPTETQHQAMVCSFVSTDSNTPETQYFDTEYITYSEDKTTALVLDSQKYF